MRVAILGAGGHGQLIADAVWANPETCDAEIFFLDDNPSIHGTEPLGIHVLGGLNLLAQTPHDAVIVAIGDNQARRRLACTLMDGNEHFINVIHPRASLGRNVHLGCGIFVSASAVISTGSQVGDFSIVNTGSTIGHHGRIGDYVHVGPGVHTGGDVTLGEGVFLGVGCNVVPQRTIGAWAIAGAGALVHKDVDAGDVVVGVPAKSIRKIAQ